LDAIRYYEEVRESGTSGYLAKHSKAITATERRQRAQRMEGEISEIIADLDDEGRWTEGEMVYARLFVKNFGMLCEYLEGMGTDAEAKRTVWRDYGHADLPDECLEEMKRFFDKEL